MPKTDDPTLLFLCSQAPSEAVYQALLSISDALGHTSGFSICILEELANNAKEQAAQEQGADEQATAEQTGAKQSAGEQPAVQNGALKSQNAQSSKTAEIEQDFLETYIYEVDPWAIVALDAKAINALRSAFGKQSASLKEDKPIEVCGYTLVAVLDFENCLDNEEQKRIAWGRLKAAQHPKNPLD